MIWTSDADERKYLRKCYTQKWWENCEEDGPGPDG